MRAICNLALGILSTLCVFSADAAIVSYSDHDLRVTKGWLYSA